MKLLSVAVALAAVAQASSSYINYTTVTGYFLQDEEATDASTFDYTATNFGLINRTYEADKHSSSSSKKNGLTQWERFYKQVSYLNEHAAHGVSYKVLFLGRHGEGYHNAAESYYGTPAWNCYWSLLTGNSTATWADADLTPAGVQQAQIAHDFWAELVETERIHLPDSFYVSPLTRALRTANITFTGIFEQNGKPKTNGKGNGKEKSAFTPLIKESLREGISLHTCDHRRNKSYIRNLFPEWEIEASFTETDELWNGVTGETSAAQDVRSKGALDAIFSSSSSPSSSSKSKSKSAEFVSVTSHSGEISSILRVLGHRAFSLKTGAVIPVLVRAETIHEPKPTTSVSWTVSAHCTAPPVTSVTACVCPSSAAPVTTLLS